jgi:hypothetical protein
VRTLDSFRISGCNVLMMDVQGYELEVLKGARETLGSIDHVFTEINRAELYEGCPMAEDLDLFLAGFGFFRAETDWAGGTWGDAYYRKTDGA